MDFTYNAFQKLCQSLQYTGRPIATFQQTLEGNPPQFIILRHDIDKKKQNALEFARMESELGIIGTYFFRITEGVFDRHIMDEINKLGHEIGYHYEDISLVSAIKKEKGKSKKEKRESLIDMAYESFCRHLELFRRNVDVKTICMHGSPLSKYDNRDLWEKYNYRDLGIIGEPYFDLDFNEVFYLTDTGRRWDNEGVAVRDKIKDQRLKIKDWGLKFHSTSDIIKAAGEGRLPDKMMITIHPQRWNDALIPWTVELVGQNIKNMIKKYYFIPRNRPSI